ncbi:MULTISPECIES: sorbosone dehydrogenase family protein [unclassified Phenylobacterium]|uniref:PQQ-dependent sugar dehydrogenase n=1 Tax=unclassified Phenylobacterium TaxID=2640670 RepID=UPI000AF67BA1|nr:MULTISPECIES: PQQ-dependent sugar dehydrogenase [unclassified Phenylobacterium]
MRGLLAALALALVAGAAQAQGYARDGRTCDGYPRAPIETMKGMCAGIVLAPPPAGLPPSRRTLHLPRTLLPLPGGDWLVADLGTWDPGRGSVWRLTPRPSGEPGLRRLLSKLDLPHTLAVGPDGKAYLSEMSRISRFDPDAADPQATLTPVVTGLPDNRLHENRHPLSAFIFDADGALLVNVGAPSDQCPPRPGEARCAEAERHAALWRFAPAGPGKWAPEPTVFARGLRNSLALVRTRAGTVLQAENSIDVPDPAWPPEELNVIEAGAHYGWPYCMGAGQPAPAWKARKVSCAPFRKPGRLMPAHAAPLDLVEYRGAMFPELAGRLLVSLHGYRPTGSRILAYALDDAGRPTAAAPIDLTPGWRAMKGRRPSGAPVGLSVAADGAIWIADDRNGAILRLARDRK